jgi:glycolate dehydrogenase FAD-binding subunit
VSAAEQAEAARAHVQLDDAVIEAEDDHEMWALRRGLQRGDLIVKVSGRPTDLESVIAEARRLGGTVVSRAALGLSWISLPPGADVAGLREALAPRACTVLDGAADVADPWPAIDPGALAVMERIKARFDPGRAFKPGAFVGGL